MQEGAFYAVEGRNLSNDRIHNSSSNERDVALTQSC